MSDNENTAPQIDDLFDQEQPAAEGGASKADASWFHIFRQMFDTGDVKRMGSHAFTIYCAIKFHVNFQTGVAFPSIERLSDFTGISERQIKRELAVLEELGYLFKKKVGRHNQYTLREKVQVVNAEGRPVAEATWDYLPTAVKAATAELRNYIQTGTIGSIIHIESLTIQNLNVVKAESGSEVSIINVGADSRDQALSVLNKVTGKKSAEK